MRICCKTAMVAMGLSIAMGGALFTSPVIVCADEANVERGLTNGGVLQENAKNAVTITYTDANGGEQQGDFPTILDALIATTGMTNRTVKLNSSVTESGFDVYDNTTLEIDLNGQALTINSSIVVDGDLLVKDSAAEAAGVKPEYDESGSVTYTAGVINLSGEDVFVSVMGGSKFELSGGIISGTKGCIRVTSGDATISGGYVESTDGAAVEVADGCKFTATGGIVKAIDYAAVAGDAMGGRGDTTVSISEDAVILAVRTGEGEYAVSGVCEIQDNGTLNVNGGVIKAIGGGVGAVIDDGTFTMTGGEVYGSGNVSGKTVSGVSVDNGYGLVVNYTAAESSISGGFISADSGVDSFRALPSLARLAGTNLSISGGTFTKTPTDFSDYLAQNHTALGHALNGRDAWATVLENKSIDTSGNASGANIYYGDLTYYKDAENDYPTESNRLFAGWWNREECGGNLGNNGAEEFAYQGKTGKAYAKMVNQNLLIPVRAQLPSTTTSSSESTIVRFILLTDSLDYESVGFKAWRNLGNGFASWFDEATTTVFSEMVTTEGKLYPGDYSKAARYFFAVSSSIPNAGFNTTIGVQNYWKTLDGTLVNGGSGQMTVNSLINQMTKE